MGDQSFVVDGLARVKDLAKALVEANLGKSLAAWSAEQEERKKDPEYREGLVYRQVADRLLGRPETPLEWYEYKRELADFEGALLRAAKAQGWLLLSDRNTDVEDPTDTKGRLPVLKVLNWLRCQERPNKAVLVKAMEAILPPGIAQNEPLKRREKATTLQEDSVIKALLARGVDPMQMPKPPLGNKPWPLRVEIGSELKYSKSMMTKTFDRLRKSGRMKNA